MSKIARGRGIWLSGLLLAVMLAACQSATSTTSATSFPALVSSPESLPSPLPTAQAPPPIVLRTQPPESPQSRVGTHPLPACLARIPLAPAGQVLGQLLVDPQAGRLYVTDSTGILHVLDSATYKEIAAVPVSSSWEPIYGVRGSLILDAARQRLYVGVESRPEGIVTTVDTGSLTIAGTITPGGAVSLDAQRNRLYVGRAEFDNPLWDQSYLGVAQATGKVYDARTLVEVGNLPVKGKPVYDPLADELLIVAFTVHRVDPGTLVVTGDLLPEVSAQPCPECSGVSSAADARLDLERNLLTVELQISSAGHSVPCGPGDRHFDATTLKPVADPHATPPLDPTCNEQRGLPPALRERAYAAVTCEGYVQRGAVLAYGLDGKSIASLDGIRLGLTNPNTCQSYVPQGDRVVVLDLPAFAPVGTLPLADYTLDATTGRLYGVAGPELLVFAEAGGSPETTAPEPPEAAELPAREILLIRPSPDYAHDQTVFVGIRESAGYPYYNAIYRSIDGGESWVLLRGGLPQGELVALDLAVSPDFAADHTLFAGGFRGTLDGLGVFRSTDAGDTWQPSSRGLRELRVEQLLLSPDYARDGALLAVTQGSLVTGASNRSVHLSTDRGEHWTRVAMGDPQNIPDLLPAPSKQPPARFRLSPTRPGPGGRVERRMAGTNTWRPVYQSDLDDDAPVAILPSPAMDIDHTVHVLTHAGLWRSTDLGETWERCPRPRLDSRQSENWVTAGALVGNRLFVGTMAGEFFSLDVTRRPCGPAETGNLWTP